MKKSSSLAELAVTALFVGTDELCDPDIEECAATETLTGYEDYERFTLLIGMILTVSAFMPLLFFLIIWYTDKFTSSASRAKLFSDHLYYAIAWVWTAGSHFIMIAPWTLAWFDLFLLSDAPYEGSMYDFYKFWMEDVLVNLLFWLVVATSLTWLAVIILEFNNEDDVFLVVYPAFVLGVYVLLAPPTSILVSDNWEKAIKYFDATEIDINE